MNLVNKVAIVTGASSGIGAAIAVKLAELGAKVAIVGRNQSKLNNVSETCEKRGLKPLTIVADVSKDEDSKRIITETLNSFQKIDVLVNNAGIVDIVGISEERAMEAFDRIMAVNLRAPFYLTHLAAKHLIETKGNIVNISSIAGMKILSYSPAYSISKAALDHFTRCAAAEFATHGVRVNSINPGPIRTGMIDNHGLSEEEKDKKWKILENNTAFKRLGESEEIAELVAFLLSGKAISMTGSLIVTDNGALL